MSLSKLSEKVLTSLDKRISKHYEEIEDFADRYVRMLLKASQNILVESDLLNVKEVEDNISALQQFCGHMREEIKIKE